MKINFKKSGFLIISTSMVLTACGGGSNQSNEPKIEENQVQEDALYQVYYQRPNISWNTIDDFFEITKYSIKNDEIFFAKSNNKPLENRIFTETKILEKGALQPNKLKKISATQWSYERTPELKQTLKFELVSLVGENIFDRILPGYRNNLNLTSGLNGRVGHSLIAFDQNYKDSVFPKDSYCYRLKETEWNQAYISQLSEFGDTLFTKEREKVVSEYDNLSNSPYFNKADHHLVWGKWHGYDWMFLLNNINIVDSLGILGNVDNKSASVLLTESMPWKVDNSLTYERNLLKILETGNSDSPLGKEILLDQKLRVDNLEKGCFAFNSQAINAIKKLNLINWKQGDSSDIGQFLGTRTWTSTIGD